MLGSFTGVFASGSFTPFASADFIVLSGVIVAVLPSGNVTVVVPSCPTSTFVAVGFAFLTSSFTFAFSSSVKLLGSFTGVFVSGSFTPFASADFIVLSGVIVAVEPSGNVTVVVPSCPTSTFVAVGFAFLTASSTFTFSSSVKLLGSFTGVTSGSLTLFASADLTVLSGVIVVVLPSGNVTVVVPSCPTSTFVAVGFAFLTASSTFAFSSSVKLLASFTGVFVSGSLTLFASAGFTVLVNLSGCFASEPAPLWLYVTSPLASTSISASSIPGFAFLTSSFTLAFSSSVKLLGFLTGTLVVIGFKPA